MRLALIDLSGIYRAHWHATEHEEIGEAYKRTLSSVQSFASGFDHVGICIDRPPYNRNKIDPEYKAQRQKAPDVMHEQQRAVIERLRCDGHHIFGADGYEADDAIATLCAWAESNEHETTVFSADKDLLQLVTKRTTVISTSTRQKYDAQAVVDKFGVHPELIPDMLALMGDKSDNIQGVRGCGPKRAAKWLNAWGDLEGVLVNAAELEGQSNGILFAKAVEESKETISKAWKLTRLATDAPINPEKILEPMAREEKPEASDYELESDPYDEPEEKQVQAHDRPDPVLGKPDPEPMPAPEIQQKPAESQALIPRAEYAETTWDKSLEPRDPRQAWGVAKMLFESRLFGAFPNPEAILAIVMTGRSFGMDSTSSLRGFHMIKGKVSPSSQLLIGLVKRHPSCEWFRLVESTSDIATWETKRRDEPEPTRMSYTVEDAKLAGLLDLDQWRKRKKTMLRWRSGVELARAVYPDVTSGLYTIEEMLDVV